MNQESYSFRSWFESGFYKKSKRIGLNGLKRSARAYLLSLWREEVSGPFLIIAPYPRYSEFRLEDFRFFQREGDGPACLFPQWETLPYDEIPPHPEIIRERVNCLFSLMRDEGAVIISSVKALLQRVLLSSDLRGSTHTLAGGEEIDRNRLVEFLHEGGYA